MAASERNSLPKDFLSVEQAADFWDTHSLGDYAEQLKPARVSFKIGRRVHVLAVDPEIAAGLRAASKIRGLSPETLANLWLRERLSREAKPARRRRRAA